MSSRMMSVVALAVVAVLALPAAPAYASGSYRARIERYVADRPQQARIVRMALSRAGWGYTTAAEKNRAYHAVLVSAGESGMNPTNDRNRACSGLFQILNGKAHYGRWTAAELSNPATVRHYTLVEYPWRFGQVRKYRNGAYIGNAYGWYLMDGYSGSHPTHYRWGLVRQYRRAAYIGDGPGFYRAPPVVHYEPKVGEYKIFNPVFNAEVALRMQNARGWQPWTVARKLGIR